MKTIIAGSRGITQEAILDIAIANCPFIITSVVSGGARGVDKLGETFSKKHHLPLYLYPAKWDLFGKSAGYIRNKEMAENSEALLAIWDGSSKGTKHMIDLAKKYKLTIYIHTV